MPQCKKCHNQFSSTYQHQGKTVYIPTRQQCFVCLPYKHRGPRLEDVAQGTDVTCNRCGRNYKYHHTLGHSTVRCNSCVVNARRSKIKKFLVDSKGGKCIKCGYNKSMWSLIFHHRDPRQKQFNVNGARASIKLERILEEVEKCDLLCANCHGELHENINNLV